MKTPTISVVMPVYNSGKYLREAIESILNQDFKDFEFLILNDGSTDDSLDIIKSYNDPRIRLFDSQHNEGLVFQLNKGLKEARGKYIARMDSDDTCTNDRLLKQYKFLENNKDIGIVGTYLEFIGNKTGYWQTPPKDKGIRFNLFLGSPFGHNAVLFKREIVANNNLEYRKESFPVEDIDMWMRLLQFTKGANLPYFMTTYRVTGNQITSNNVELSKSKHYNICRSYFEKYCFTIESDDEYAYSVFIGDEKLNHIDVKRYAQFCNRIVKTCTLDIPKSFLRNQLDRIFLMRLVQLRDIPSLIYYLFEKNSIVRFFYLSKLPFVFINKRFSK